ncbi:MAG: ATP-grasp domain-containing protein [Mesorhizobium sp.]|uniref:ATP-grasp domain-containing protein n=1 Tax=Mesorhizobium sp. TaxID=1871066 RepID=UPI001226DE59|nr:acetyl-CoA carboxylase biotin carboxylase subunit family protein [Mesorhizobium sp.]TIL21980.1 MAG: ATP-grasp domain-containing protein [Mesorhizobium sp.]TIQ45203.1 MAG: ATP-grasp domain-containing protein [Mesorhizobium sp.]TIW63282.1 MAG: ATP-grasp domain-containing protein [Mesorhizobium sp.]TIW68310.1 MAG: ATP-grasp domain-containing protein [Mesorhizobium sp.]TJW33559.1 MAG: ATP-grasp domain-containing protein [Mesorhizobium sp.]
MTRRALILVEGHTTANGPQYARAAQHLGLHPIILSAHPSHYDHLAAEGIEAVRVDTGNLDALIRECSRLRTSYDIAGITSAAESFYATSAKLCRYFALPGANPASIERCCDKFTQRQLLAEALVPVPGYRLAANATEVESSADEIGLPVILKPAVGSGSRGVRLCSTVDELAEHTTYLLGGKHVWRSSPRILVEEFAQGPHYIAHIMGNEVVGIEAADFDSPPHFLFREGIFPAPLTDDEHESLAGVSLSCLRALGLGWGPTCIELRWTKVGPVVIEVNPRLGAGPLHIQLAYGLDLITEHIKLVIGNGWNLRKTHSHVAAWRNLLPDRDGTLEWIDNGRLAAGVPGVAEVKLHVESKTRIVRNGDSRDSMGYVMAVSPTLAHTEAILQRAVDLISWSITPFPSVEG